MNNSNKAARPRESDNLAGLAAKFMPYIRRRANRVASLGLARDDIVQEGLIGLLGAVSSFDPAGGASFETFAITCIDNAINSAIRAASRKKNLPLNSALPLSEELDWAAMPSPEEIAILRDEHAALLERINKDLSEFERDVLALYVEGYSYRAMAELLKTSPKAVDNALQRARRKLSR